GPFPVHVPSPTLMAINGIDSQHPTHLRLTERNRWLHVALAALVTLPWLFPFTAGPSAAAWPWIVSAACGCLLACSAHWSLNRQFLALAAACAFVTLWAWLSHPSAAVDVIYLAAGLALIVMAAAVAPDIRLRDSIKTGLLLAALVSAALGLIQYFGLSAHFAPWVNFAPGGEAYANLRQTNQYATLCWIGMAVLLCTLPSLHWGYASAAAILLATASAASVSRTGLVQGVALLLLAVLWPASDRRRRLALCAIAGIAYVAASSWLPLAFEALTGTLPARTLISRISNGAGCQSRMVLWSNVLQLIAARPWLGWGWGGLDEAHFMTLYPGARFCEILDNAHNLPLHLAVELGVPVSVLVTGGVLAWVWRGRPWRDQDAQRQLAWGMLALLGIHSLLEYPLWYGPFQIACGAAIGWLLPAAGALDHRSRSGTAGRLLAGALLVATGLSAWDYWRASQVYLPPQQRRAAWRDDPLQEARRSWLFAAPGQFAELTLTPLTPGNAREMEQLAQDMLRYSPEPRTVERLIEAETLLGHEREAVAMLARYRAAFPDDYARWRDANKLGGRVVSSPTQD
ncbi:MAG: PglL family O-oligosaccharyltransferase, partial [Ramlibacter sp.]